MSGSCMLADHKECGVCEAKYAGLQETLPPVFDNSIGQASYTARASIEACLIK